MTMIRNLKEFCAAHPGGPEWSGVVRATYKYTDCGAWINQVLIGQPGTDRQFEVVIRPTIGKLVCAAWRNPGKKWNQWGSQPGEVTRYFTLPDEWKTLNDAHDNCISKEVRRCKWRGLDSLIVRVSIKIGRDAKPGIAVGSIVEGVDQDADTVELAFPLTMADFWRALSEVEASAAAIWNDTHGCEGCAKLLATEWEPGVTPVVTSCRECDGHGTIL